MSENIEELERPVSVRVVDTQITAGDGRTVSFRIAPFNEIAESQDGNGFVPRGVVYKEQLMPGLYDHQIPAAHRILLNFEHQQGIAGIVGKGISLEQKPDGYHASFRILEGPDGDKALALIKEGVLTGASIESVWLRSKRSMNGIVQRFKAHLEAVAICRVGAYPSAVLTAMRTAEVFEDEMVADELMPVAFDAGLAERIRRLGHDVPESLAHPNTDTPELSGTPGSAPAPPVTEPETEPEP